MAGRLLDLGNIDLWRSEEMQLVQVGQPFCAIAVD